MPALLNLIGLSFGRLTVIERLGQNPSGAYLWKCSCSCGGTATCVGAALKNGNSTSCGCARNEKTVARNTRHNQSYSLEYSTWCAMKKRCQNTSDTYFADYGGRGIQVCARWDGSFEFFLQDMGPRPSADYSIERSNVNGHYEPNNCYWATQLEQARNRRNNRLVEFEGSSFAMSELAEREKVDYHQLKYRLNKGMTPSDAIADLRGSLQ
jgi:ribosomal protein S16